ncbi:NAD(P)(+)--arginine ADP-ribosyltransferase 1-like [Crotalus tigris]|uniref:NAD(P)(+)--arginine ADP-ribosyltransferase 1-like n=1 Tax=Crotalus tigris TaxID=88082 RepID=UPI00192F4FBC|nr:NAD(P)(+)--arginine ADP-ribosyltransferase 1-like [Crotalus tigris]
MLFSSETGDKPVAGGTLLSHPEVSCVKVIPLDMSMNSLDDPYYHCHSKIEEKLKIPGYVPLPKKYFKTWNAAKIHLAKILPTLGNFNRMYGTAIMAYTIGDSLYSDFNAAVREGGKSKYAYKHFAFKDFYFVFNRALQAKKTGPACYEVFRGIKGVRFTVPGKVVRFGQFASSSKIKKIAQGFGEDTFFSIKTCYGVSISPISLRPYQQEVIIPPYEKFIVISRKKTDKGVFIRLVSQGLFSRFNCDALKGH